MLNRFRLAYRLQIDDGRVSAVQGHPPNRFVAAVADIVRLHDIDSGRIECKGLGPHARLRFSKEFPKRGRQAIRNAWTPPTTPGPTSGPRASG